jgi:hypothetical protein
MMSVRISQRGGATSWILSPTFNRTHRKRGTKGMTVRLDGERRDDERRRSMDRARGSCARRAGKSNRTSARGAENRARIGAGTSTRRGRGRVGGSLEAAANAMSEQRCCDQELRQRASKKQDARRGEQSRDEARPDGQGAMGEGTGWS